MCGIVGVIGRQEQSWVEAMCDALVHRGPDDRGVYLHGEREVAFGMRRLAILDIAGGAQPMSTEDGRYVIVFNGEIFNAASLRIDLEREGVRFSTDHSDTEVLLRLVARHGEGAIDRLDGMFAFALYDRRAGTLLCARDRAGIKPFYYVRRRGRFAFASELKCLTLLPWVERVVDRQSLYDYLSLMYIPGERTILDGVSRLPPGHSLRYEIETRRSSVRRWWRPIFRPDRSVHAAEWPGRVRCTLARAVKDWSIADTPIACSLSGGLDSSSVVAMLAENGGTVRTVSLGFRGPGEAAWDELPLARAVAQKWGTEHSEIVLDPDSLLVDLGRMVRHLDEPYGGGLPSWSVFQEMGKTVKVAFTGTGGDELFGNYGKWRYLEGGWLRKRLHRAVDSERFGREFFDRYYYFSDGAKREVLVDGGGALRNTAEMLYQRYTEAGCADLRDRVACVDLGTQLPEEFLMMTDRFSMAHSVEARTPFLANRMIDLALSIPADVRMRRGDIKGLLREAVAPLLPEALHRAPKRGFVIPLGKWLRGRLRPLAERLLAPACLAEQGIFRPTFYPDCVAPHLAGVADNTQRIWAVLMFQLWYQQMYGAGDAEIVI